MTGFRRDGEDIEASFTRPQGVVVLGAATNDSTLITMSALDLDSTRSISDQGDQVAGCLHRDRSVDEMPGAEKMRGDDHFTRRAQVTGSCHRRKNLPTMKSPFKPCVDPRLSALNVALLRLLPVQKARTSARDIEREATRRVEVRESARPTSRA